MKSHAKSKRHASHAKSHKHAHAHRKHVPAKSRTEIAQEGTDVSRAATPEITDTMTPMQTGSPDRDEGRGPTGQEGEGEAQNDQLAALEETEPEKGADI